MDITVYFLKLEDKYWGLFLIGLVLLFALAKSRVKEAGPLFVCAFAGYLLFLCPLTYRALSRFFVPETRYELLSHIFLYPLILPLAAALGGSLIEKQSDSEKEKKMRGILYGAFLLLLFFLSGDFFVLSRGDFTGQSFYDKDMKASYEAVLADAASSGKEPVIWGPADWMAASRLYDGRLKPLYGKDITTDPEKYGDVKCQMRQGYDNFESPDAPLENREDQIGAIANFPNLYPDLQLSYVAVPDPADEGLSVDAQAIFCDVGYTFTGKYGGLLVFARNQ